MRDLGLNVIWVLRCHAKNKRLPGDIALAQLEIFEGYTVLAKGHARPSTRVGRLLALAGQVEYRGWAHASTGSTSAVDNARTTWHADSGKFSDLFRPTCRRQ